MKNIYIVKTIAGNFEDHIEKNIKAFTNKAKAQEYADKLNEKYDCIVDLDLYCNAEIYVSNDIIQDISTYSGFYDFTCSMMENLKDSGVQYYKETKDAWLLLEGIYAAHKDISWHDFVHNLLYDNEGNKSQDYSYWFAILLKIFCSSLRIYSIEDLQLAVEIYQYTWSKPHAFVEDIELVK